MATIVVGGHARKVGKTSVVAGLIAALSEFRWTAVKLSPHAHGGMGLSRHDKTRGKREPEFAVYRETDPANTTDSSRFLASGAAFSFLVRFRDGHLAEVIPKLRPVFDSSPYLILESNRIVDHIRADLHIVVLRPDVSDFKKGAVEMLAKADAAVLVALPPEQPLWPRAAHDLLRRLPVIPVNPPEYAPEALVELVRARLRLAGP